MPEDLMDNEQRETFIVSGEAPDVLQADQAAWAALESCLGRDPVAAWKLAQIQHAFKGPGYLDYTATFERDPSVPVPPVGITYREVTDEDFENAKRQIAQEKAAKGRGPRS